MKVFFVVKSAAPNAIQSTLHDNYLFDNVNRNNKTKKKTKKQMFGTSRATKMIGWLNAQCENKTHKLRILNSKLCREKNI